MNRNVLMSLGAAIATSRLARTLSNVDPESVLENVLGSIGLERQRSYAWQNIAIFSVGALAGAGAALLLAPSSGRDVRARLGSQLDKLATAANEAVQDVKTEAPALISRVTGGVGNNQTDPQRNQHS